MVTFHRGTGTSADPFVIKSDSQATAKQQFELMGDAAYVGGGYYFELDEDIDFSGYAFTGIGTSETPFRGHLNCRSHEVKNISPPSSNNHCIFKGDNSSSYIEYGIFSGISVSLSGPSYNVYLVDAHRIAKCEFHDISLTVDGTSTQSVWATGHVIRTDRATDCIFHDISISTSKTTTYSGSRSAVVFNLSDAVTEITNCLFYDLNLSSSSTGSVSMYSCGPVRLKDEYTQTIEHSVVYGETITVDNIQSGPASSAYGLSGRIKSVSNVRKSQSTMDWGTTTNCYGISPITIGGTAITTGVEARDGKPVSSSDVALESWWKTTSALTWDWDEVWYWDSANNVPRLRKYQSGTTIPVKVSGAWKTGTPYVKVSGAWKEASAVYVKVDGAWKEAQ